MQHVHSIVLATCFVLSKLVPSSPELLKATAAAAVFNLCFLHLITYFVLIAMVRLDIFATSIHYYTKDVAQIYLASAYLAICSVYTQLNLF